MLLKLRNSIRTEEFDYIFLKNALKKYKNPRVKINELLKKKNIIRVKKGLYVFGPELSREPYSKETLANLIYGPSYISLEYALSFYGLIPERIETVTSITNKRIKYFNTPIGNFSYKYINPAIYSYGITLYQINEYHNILIASKEKALSDLLYFYDKINDEIEMQEYLFGNLRIEVSELSKLNVNKIRQFAKLYGKNVTIFFNYISKKLK